MALLSSITNDGWLDGCEIRRSENYNSRPKGVNVSLLVVHCISLPPGEYGGGYIEDFFQNKLKISDHSYFSEIQSLKVSAHCLIARSGSLTQFVPFGQRAWHAGQSNFEGLSDCNDYSIGIELEGTESTPYTEEQYITLVALTRQLKVFYPDITNERIVGHSAIAPGRKTDPGPCFDWEYFFELL